MSTSEGTTEHYVGTELELFRHATNWKRYFARQLEPFLTGRVLEVGAGLGGTTVILDHRNVKEWLCLEPDPKMVGELGEMIAAGRLPHHCSVVKGVLGDLPHDRRFETILYIDVLEHIEDDRRELEAARAHLADGGRLVVLSPAHQWLFSPFDAAIGHHRRYSKASLEAIAPASLELLELRYLDSVGVMASATNRFFMKQSMPNARQLQFWDRVLVPLSTIVDRLTLHRLGKSVLAVWGRREA